jgi:hypothetical protein
LYSYYGSWDLYLKLIPHGFKKKKNLERRQLSQLSRLSRLSPRGESVLLVVDAAAGAVGVKYQRVVRYMLTAVECA